MKAGMRWPRRLKARRIGHAINHTGGSNNIEHNGVFAFSGHVGLIGQL